MGTSLQTTFREICRDFFPRWRTSTGWTIVEGPHGQWVDAQGETHTTREHGYCDLTTKTIFINHGWSRSSEYQLIIIHEICHAVTSGSHDKRFCTPLRHAAQRARDLGDRTLSAKLLEEADAYEHTALALGSPYRRIPEIVRDNPGATFAQVLTYLAYEYSETAPALGARYPRLRAVYDRARRQELTTVRYQLKATRRWNASTALVTSLEERLRSLEAVTDGGEACP
jgi:hypothetical protein